MELILFDMHDICNSVGLHQLDKESAVDDRTENIPCLKDGSLFNINQWHLHNCGDHADSCVDFVKRLELTNN